MNKKRKFYKRMLVIGLAGLIVGTLTCYLHILDRVVTFQQNIIGVLYQTDAQYVEKYLYAMFETVSQENIESANTALEEYGFTEAGIQYIGKNMGLWKSGFIGIGLLLLTGGVVLFVLYKEMGIQKQEIEVLKQENFSLKQNQMGEEYQISQNKRIQSFIENIAHQMKTPLSRVFSSLDIVEESLTDEETKQHVEECYLHLESMNVLMKRLMDIGRLEAGKVIFQKERLYLDELIKDVIKNCTDERSRVKVNCEEKIRYYGDGEWLKEAFSNILCNALEADKEERPVEISCSRSEDYVKISIRDHGPGICEKDIPNVFDRFYLSENVKANHTGIGLNLAKLILEGHMGSVYVYNHCEGGAVFQMILPAYDSLKVRM